MPVDPVRRASVVRHHTCDVTPPRRLPRFDIRRIYDRADSSHYRVLVDRLWPRGIRKEDALLDEWAKNLAPTTDLRRWYGHDTTKFIEFRRRYGDELDRPSARTDIDRLLGIATERTVVLVTSTRDIEHSGAEVLRQYLTERSG